MKCIVYFRDRRETDLVYDMGQAFFASASSMPLYRHALTYTAAQLAMNTFGINSCRHHMLLASVASTVRGE